MNYKHSHVRWRNEMSYQSLTNDCADRLFEMKKGKCERNKELQILLLKKDMIFELQF